MSGLGDLLRLTIRRNRWFYLAWVLALAITPVMTASAYEAVLGQGATKDVLIATLEGNPTMRAMLGPPFDLTTPGGFSAWRVGTFTATMACIMTALGVIRSTRADEEEGRTELVRAGSVDRRAPLTAAVLIALAAATVLGILMTVGLIGLGQAVAGSIAYGLGTTLVAAVFAGVAAVTAQITASARAARGMAMGALGAMYAARAVADGVSETSVLRPMQWASPVEWMALARPYAGERWWVLALPAALALVLVLAAYRLEAVRDHGSGLRATASGRPHAKASLLSPEGLAWRLQRGSVIGWTLGMMLFAFAMGSLSGSMGDMLKEAPVLEEIFRRMGQDATDLVDAFYTAMLGIVGVVVAVMAVQLFQRLGQEERRQHAEMVLATSVPRLRFALSHIGIAVIAGTVLMGLVGFFLALPEAIGQGHTDRLGQIAGAGLALAPGVLLVLGLAVFLHGWLPRFEWITWVVVFWSLFVIWVGGTLNLPDWMKKLTPWELLPKIPAEPMDWAPVLISVLVALALMALGLIGYRRRDIRS
ncbi:ABC transporter permease [Actinomycetota bacterium]